MSGYALRTACADDDAGILKLVGAPQPSTGLTLGFEREPSYFLSAAVSHEQPDVMVVTNQQDGSVVAVVNLGSRRVYVNGEAQSVFYGGDMRIAPEHQGGRVLLYVNRMVRQRLGDHGWYQTVILRENRRSRSTFDQGGRAGLPVYHPQQNVMTCTLTGCRSLLTDSGCTVREATAADVPAMNAFVQQMAARFARRSTSIPTFSGRCGEQEATSASRPRSSSLPTRSAPWAGLSSRSTRATFPGFSPSGVACRRMRRVT